jgi:hypothetical protein
MLRGLMLFGVTDGAECMLGLQRNASQCVAGEGNRAVGEITPVAVAPIVQAGRIIQDEPGAFERDKAIRELVLDRLEFSDGLPELVALLGVVHRQIERPPRGTMCSGHQCQPCREPDISERGGCKGKKRQRRRSQPDLAEPPRAHGARRQDFDAGTIHPYQCKVRLIDGNEKMGGFCWRLDETKHARCTQAID